MNPVAIFMLLFGSLPSTDYTSELAQMMVKRVGFFFSHMLTHIAATHEKKKSSLVNK